MPRDGRRLAWWAWPHVLSLDAPAVAVAWSGLACAWCGIPVSWATGAALASIVWAVYLLDRLADQRRGQATTLRHGFAAAWRRGMAALLLCALVSAAHFVGQTPAALRQPGAALGAVVAAYFVAVHGMAAHFRRKPVRMVRGVKEAVAGSCFAVGTCLPIWGGAAAPTPNALGIVALFVAACWWNCRLIDRWEGGRPFARTEAWLIAGLATAGAVLAPADARLAFLGLFLWFTILHSAAADRAVARAWIDVGMAAYAAAWWASL